MRLCDVCFTKSGCELVKVTCDAEGDAYMNLCFDLCELCIKTLREKMWTAIEQAQPSELREYIRSLTPDQVIKVRSYLAMKGVKQ